MLKKPDSYSTDSLFFNRQQGGRNDETLRQQDSQIARWGETARVRWPESKMVGWQDVRVVRQLDCQTERQPDSKTAGRQQDGGGGGMVRLRWPGARQ